MDHNTELEILKKKESGLSTSEICREYNIDKSMLYRIVARNGRPKIIPNKKYQVDEKYFEKIDNEEKAYWLGFLYADGYINDKRSEKSVEIGLSSDDSKHVFLFSKCIKSNYPIKERTTSPNYIKKNGQKCKSTHIRIYNSKLVDDLIKLGCVNNKSWIIKFPNFLNKKLEKHFVRGYFDGDGCIRKRGLNQYEVNIAGNKEFIEGLKKCLEVNLIQKSYILVRKKDGLASLVVSNNKDCLSLYRFMYADMNSNCYLSRKKEIYDKIENKEISKNNKTYKLTNKNGTHYFVKDGLRNFCLSHNLNYLKMKKNIDKDREIDGWKIEKVIEKKILPKLIYLKLFEEFVITKPKPKEVEVKKEISDKTIDDVLSDDFFEDEEDETVSVDKNGVIDIKNWKVY
jgi:hypothetical protein